MERRILNILIAIDQLLYVLLSLGKGYPDLTISAAVYLKARNGNRFYIVLQKIIDTLFLPFEEDHCLNSFISELTRKQVPESMRDDK